MSTMLVDDCDCHRCSGRRFMKDEIERIVRKHASVTDGLPYRLPYTELRKLRQRAEAEIDEIRERCSRAGVLGHCVKRPLVIYID
jgi:hypothetical protein